jgi:DNA-binding response OmpR family regulator
MLQHSIPILLVTTDVEWPRSLCQVLSLHGFIPLSIARSHAAASSLFHRHLPRLVIIDLHFPGCSVIDFCVEMLDVQPEVKVVFVAHMDTEPPLAALHVDVAGCIARDLPMAAWPGLLVHILRGGIAYSHIAAEVPAREERSVHKHQAVITIGALQIDLGKHQILYAGKRIQLTSREFALLTCLVRNQDRVVTFELLLNEAWGYGPNDGTSAQVRLYIARLRRKLREVAQIPDLISTERGIGYCFNSEVLRREQVWKERASSMVNSTYFARPRPDTPMSAKLSEVLH